ncbi:hypothetical protein [Sandaracinus amylolyticus]|uniref:Uncharacterized protein n=1 Tax=Sandaracinus amylolyticus TaxID=927083 RepID=A0A0F6YMK9_9BACT|nr:hypothetical protein [Sandaracinus amylolyticus]AKF10447.1 hypothetical protein DB32_007596 [Sandaracinus amylolyticus]
MAQLLAIGIGALAFLAWLSAAVHALLLLPHRRDDVSLGALFFQGWRFYARDTWKESGHAVHRRFLGSTGAFFALVLAGIVVSVLAAR